MQNSCQSVRRKNRLCKVFVFVSIAAATRIHCSFVIDDECANANQNMSIARLLRWPRHKQHFHYRWFETSFDVRHQPKEQRQQQNQIPENTQTHFRFDSCFFFRVHSRCMVYAYQIALWFSMCVNVFYYVRADIVRKGHSLVLALILRREVYVCVWMDDKHSPVDPTVWSTLDKYAHIYARALAHTHTHIHLTMSNRNRNPLYRRTTSSTCVRSWNMEKRSYVLRVWATFYK